MLKLYSKLQLSLTMAEKCKHFTWLWRRKAGGREGHMRTWGGGGVFRDTPPPPPLFFPGDVLGCSGVFKHPFCSLLCEKDMRVVRCGILFRLDVRTICFSFLSACRLKHLFQKSWVRLWGRGLALFTNPLPNEISTVCISGIMRVRMDLDIMY